MACGVNPIKENGTPKLVPRLCQMVDGWAKEDPPTQKRLPVEADVPEFLVKAGSAPDATERMRAVGDWSLAAFYYLLRIGEYTDKAEQSQSKQTKQFKMKDVRFFHKNKHGNLCLLDQNASEDAIMDADGATLKV